MTPLPAGTRTAPTLPLTLTEALERAASAFPHRRISLLDSRGALVEDRSFPDLRDAAAIGARRWTALGLRRSDRVAVCLPTSWSFLDAWLGAQLLGALPVAMAPPAALGSPDQHIARTAEIASRLGARYLVCSAGFRTAAGELGLEGPPQLIGEDELATVVPAPASTVREAAPEPESVAFLQLTSGSTGLPRAAAISHQAAIHNAAASSEAIGRPHGEPAHLWAETMVSWLPLHHDMGLVGGLLFSLVNGLDLTLLNPRAFLARPKLWLESTARGAPTLSPAPNFAYQMCADRCKVEGLQGLDLGGWRAAMTGAEMVRPETVEDFCRAFAPFGFSPEAVRPCYGMAEATLAVTFDSRGEGVRTRPLPAGGDLGLGLREVVSNGTPILDTRVEIAAPDGRPQPAGRIGEVRVQGPGVFSGYWDDDTATAETLRDGWLYTGDLGFLDDDGELYLTGRTKDILILHGHNVMPHELEWIAEGVGGGGGELRCGAFSIAREHEGEQAVVVLESNERRPETLDQLRHEVARRIGREVRIPLGDLVLVRRGSIPKTSSGKVKRRALRELYLEGSLERLE